MGRFHKLFQIVLQDKLKRVNPDSHLYLLLGILLPDKTG